MKNTLLPLPELAEARMAAIRALCLAGPCIAALALAACQGGSAGTNAGTPSSASAQAAPAQATPAPVALTDAEITAAFAGVTEDYAGLDRPGVTAVSTFGADGAMRSDWRYRDETGTADGRWYAENGQRCIAYTNPPAPDFPNPECLTLLQDPANPGGPLTSLNADGTPHGTHTLRAVE